MTLDEKYEKFKEIDPLLANKIHKNDKHRIDNYLKIHFETN
jgi:tRNA A37 N6-isopentenylltransferase MiaA